MWSITDHLPSGATFVETVSLLHDADTVSFLPGLPSPQRRMSLLCCSTILLEKNGGMVTRAAISIAASSAAVARIINLRCFIQFILFPTGG